MAEGSTTGTATLKDRVVKRLRERVMGRGLKPGDVLGTQDQLVEEFGVSRPILREAIQELNAYGLLRSVQKVGVVVTRPDPLETLEAVANLTAGDAEDILDLCEARYALEVGAIDTVVERITDVQIDAMEETAYDYRQLLGSASANPEKSEALDCSFHCRLLEATDNPWLIRMHRVIIAYFDRCAAAALEPGGPYHLTPTGAGEHDLLVTALRERNAGLARELLVSHLRRGQNEWRTGIPSGAREGSEGVE